MHEFLSMAYRLTKSINVSNSKGKSRVVGIGGLSCDSCLPYQMKSRGCQRFGNSFKSSNKHIIDFNGNEPKLIRVCPSSFDVSLVQSIVYDNIEIESIGGLSAYYGLPIGEIQAIHVNLYINSIRAKESISAEIEFIQSEEK